MRNTILIVAFVVMVLAQFSEAGSAKPGDIVTDPPDKLVFNGLFDASFPDDTVHLKVSNVGQKRIGFAVKLKCPEGLQGMEVTPETGTLHPGQTVQLTVTRHWSGSSPSVQTGDRVSIEWTNTPGKSGTFDFDWFYMDNAQVRRKDISFSYET